MHTCKGNGDHMSQSTYHTLRTLRLLTTRCLQGHCLVARSELLNIVIRI